MKGILRVIVPEEPNLEGNISQLNGKSILWQPGHMFCCQSLKQKRSLSPPPEGNSCMIAKVHACQES